jgi:hypothetical protein
MEAFMVSKRLILSAVSFCVIASNAPAQDRVGPVYPENKSNVRSTPSGYDPFIFDWSSGHWNYVPIPYDTRSGPFAFNWHSGRWDYYPGDFDASSVYSGREPERSRGAGGPSVATIAPWQFPSVDQASPAAATLSPGKPVPQINRPAPLINSRALNYTTSDPSFEQWYRSPSK